MMNKIFNVKEALNSWKSKIVKIFEDMDDEIFQSLDHQQYKMHDFRYRKVLTEFGIIKFKRRRFINLLAETKKEKYCYLLDEKLNLEKRQRIDGEYKALIKSEMGNGLKYREIASKYSLAKISLTTISRIFNEPVKESIFQNIKKVKLQKEQRLYINIDDGHIKVRKNGVVVKQSVRVFSFFTGKVLVAKNKSKRKTNGKKPKKNRYFLKDKRIAFVNIDKNLTTDATVLKIHEYAKRFYENYEEAKLTLGGDGAPWIRNIAKKLGSDFVLDKFHAVKYLKNTFILGHKRFSKDNQFLFKTSVTYFENGMYEDLMILLKIYASERTIKYFRNNKQGVINHGQTWNIGVSAESDISHLLKEPLGYSKRTYNGQLTNMILIRRANWFNLGRGFNNIH